MKNDYKFWILWEPTYSEPPKVRFYEKSEVEKIGEKMAMENPDKTFYIMEVVGSRTRSKAMVKPKFGKKGPPLEKAEGMERVGGVKVNVKSLYDTYQGWKERGRQVISGSKALRYKLLDGVNRGIFHYKQTKPVDLNPPIEDTF